MLCLFHFRTGGGEKMRGEGEGSPKGQGPGVAEKVQAITFITRHTRHQAPGTPGSPGSHHPFDPHLRPSFHLPFTHPLLPGLPLLVLLVPPGPPTTAWAPPPPVGRLRPGAAPRRRRRIASSPTPPTPTKTRWLIRRAHPPPGRGGD